MYFGSWIKTFVIIYNHEDYRYNSLKIHFTVIGNKTTICFDKVISFLVNSSYLTFFFPTGLVCIYIKGM